MSQPSSDNCESLKQAIDRKSLEWMPKSVWGPIKWKELHVRALLELPMTGEDIWFASFLEGLPCQKCRRHFETYLGAHPPDFSSRETFFVWTVAAHNFVNEATGKRLLTKEEAVKEHPFTPDELEDGTLELPLEGLAQP